jgi:hypothetical protein
VWPAHPDHRPPTASTRRCGPPGTARGTSSPAARADARRGRGPPAAAARAALDRRRAGPRRRPRAPSSPSATTTCSPPSPRLEADALAAAPTARAVQRDPVGAAIPARPGPRRPRPPRRRRARARPLRPRPRPRPRAPPRRRPLRPRRQPRILEGRRRGQRDRCAPVRVAVIPADASVTVDCRPLAPLAGLRPGLHLVRVDAPGHARDDRVITSATMHRSRSSLPADPAPGARPVVAPRRPRSRVRERPRARAIVAGPVRVVWLDATDAVHVARLVLDGQLRRVARADVPGDAAVQVLAARRTVAARPAAKHDAPASPHRADPRPHRRRARQPRPRPRPRPRPARPGERPPPAGARVR